MTDPLRAPTEDGAILCVPPLADLARFATALPPRNRLLHSRSEVVEAGLRFHRAHGLSIPTFGADARLLVTGHQPELFHPGVWIKNFAGARIAREAGFLPVNLIIDTDQPKSASIAIPDLTGSAPMVRTVAFDEALPGLPFECQSIRNREMFETFAERVLENLPGIGWEPLIRSWWPRVQRVDSPLWSVRFAVARHELESAWGCDVLEVPMSWVCQTASFGRFVHEMLADLPRFWRTHNECLSEYRHARRLRSKTHPVPDLEAEDAWLEAPFWIWHRVDPRRKRLFVRDTGHALELRGESQLAGVVPKSAASPAPLAELATRGWHVRSRAITTTLFARIHCADLFIHGLGGGIYDTFTDELIRRYFALPAPPFVILTATLRLPFPTSESHHNTKIKLERRIREMTYHADRYLDSTTLEPEQRFWCTQRTELRESRPETRKARRARFRSILEVNAKLRPLIAEQIHATRKAYEEAIELERVAGVLRRRDYAFCLHEEELLRKLFLFKEPPTY